MRADVKDVLRYEDELDRLGRGVPYAIRNTVNDLAFQTRTGALDHIDEHMITRNTWTKRNVQVERADLRNLTSKIGSPLDYMETQESGGVRVSKGKHGAPIPTTTASGEPETAKPRRRTVRRPNKLSMIKLNGVRRHGRTRKQRNAIAISHAARGHNRRFAYLDLGRRKGIFKVMGRRTKPRIRMVHDLTRKTLVIPKEPWLSKPTSRIGTQTNTLRLYKRRLLEQLERAHGMRRR